eukprot:CAMPEP_0114429250 /NCGR_PEP_ID=MMETSP0103-20121206/9377_1 /TAXON_ID=37642 ORGANISM="Paraphysomonas imperforata, Strain PA2" /NCGR_SAMPLE_ID=MMETSP0103 /ASSEMBLY_ACC=CAM_ASM_000201 /LENGTH=846 /DNA_ID=CAMNT_0001598557 /DNA_START=258 /DNA_END=2798 /DNA_ORIENTATION=-
MSFTEIRVGIIARQGGIVPLVALVRDGSPDDQAAAAKALRNFALDFETDYAKKIVEEGGIAPLISLVRDGSDEGKTAAAEMLRILAIVDYEVEIAKEDGITPLIALVRDGSAEGKQKAAGALMHLARKNDENKILIGREDVIGDLIVLLRHGTDLAKDAAAGALSYLFLSEEKPSADVTNTNIRVMIVRKGGIDPLYALIRDGRYKSRAASLLLTLASDDDIAAKIATKERLQGVQQAYEHETSDLATGLLRSLFKRLNAYKIKIAVDGGISPLIALLRDGAAEGRIKAAQTLKNLAQDSDDNRIMIAREGGIALMITLIREGSADDKINAVSVLMKLAANAENRVKIVTEGSGVVEETLKHETDDEVKAALGWLIVDVIVQERRSISSWITLLDYGIAKHKTKAAQELMLLASDGDNIVAIAKEGGIDPLSKLTYYGSAQGKASAVRALLYLASDADNRAMMITGLALDKLCMAYEHEAEGDVKNMLDTLIEKMIADENFSFDGEYDIDPLIRALRDGNVDNQSEAAKLLQKQIAYNERKSFTFVRKGGVPLLISLVRDGTAESKTAAARALRYLARYNSNTIGRDGGIAPLISLLRDDIFGTAEGKTEAIRALHELSSRYSENTGKYNRNTIVKEDGISPLIALVCEEEGSTTTEDKVIAAKVLSSIALDNKHMIYSYDLHMLNRAYENQSDERFKKVLGFLITDLVHNQVEVAVEAGVYHVIALVRYGFNAECKIKAARALRILVKEGSRRESHATAKAIADWRGIAPLAALVREGTAEGKTEAAETLDIIATNAYKNDGIIAEIDREGLEDIYVDYQHETDENLKRALGRLFSTLNYKRHQK